MTQAGAGIHCILELHGCPFELLDDEAFVRSAIAQAAKKARSELLTLTSHKFTPQGVTALGLLAESHISIHTWPEAGYAAVDCFTCGDNCVPQRACDYLVGAMQADNHSCLTIPRGKGVVHEVTDDTDCTCRAEPHVMGMAQ